MLFHSRWLLNGRVWLLKWTILSSISLGFSCQLESQDFGDCTGIFFLLFQERVLRDFSYVTLPWEVHLLSLSLTGVLWKRNRPSVSPLPACGQREIIIHAHTNLCLRTVQQAVMQKPSGMGVNGFCCACLSHLVIQSFHSACFTARGLLKGKKHSPYGSASTLGKMLFRFFLRSLFSM